VTRIEHFKHIYHIDIIRYIVYYLICGIVTRKEHFKHI